MSFGGFGTPAAGGGFGAFGGGGGAATPNTSFGGSFGGGAAKTPATGATGTNTTTAGGFGFGGALSTPAAGTGTPAAATGTSTTSGFGTFGANTATSTPATGSTTGGFGSATGFGGGFGAGGATTSGFGGTGTGFGAGTLGNTSTAGAGTMGATTPTNVTQRLQAIASAVDPSQPSTNMFKYPFFNRLQNPADMKRVAPPTFVDPVIQRQAQVANPDPDTMVAVWGVGFHDLKRRADEQDTMTDEHAKRLEAAASLVQELQRKLQISQQKMAAIRDKMAQQAHKHLRMAATIEVLRARGIPIQPDEDAWRVRLQAIYSELQKPNEFRGRLNEIQSKARMLSDGRAPLHLAAMLSAASNAFTETDLNSIAAFLDEQRRGIAQLTNLLKTDLANLELLYRLSHDPTATPLS